MAAHGEEHVAGLPQVVAARRPARLAVSAALRFWEYGAVDPIDPSFNELLAKAVENGDAAALAKTMAAGADFDGQDQNGKTPSMRAAHLGRVACLSVLIDAGADIDARDVDGWTAAMWASFVNCAGPSAECLNLLMRAGCQLDGLDSMDGLDSAVVKAERERRALLASSQTPTSEAKPRARI